MENWTLGNLSSFSFFARRSLEKYKLLTFSPVFWPSWSSSLYTQVQFVKPKCDHSFQEEWMGLGFCIILNSLYNITPSFTELFNYNNRHKNQLVNTCPFVLDAFLSELLCFPWDQVRVSPHKKKVKPSRRHMQFILQEPEMYAFLQLYWLGLDLRPSDFISGKRLVKDTRVLAKIPLIVWDVRSIWKALCTWKECFQSWVWGDPQEALENIPSFFPFMDSKWWNVSCVEAKKLWCWKEKK